MKQVKKQKKNRKEIKKFSVNQITEKERRRKEKNIDKTRKKSNKRHG